MIAYGAAELANSFRTVRKNTVQVAEDIPEDKYGFVAAAGVRSAGDLLKHIVYAPMLYEDMHRHKRVTTLEGYDFAAAGRRSADEEKKPKSKTEIIAALMPAMLGPHERRGVGAHPPGRARRGVPCQHGHQ